MEREPNTVYVLSLSYGKDSIATIEACRHLGYPIDRIVHAEVWATDTIPADLPPMVDFKKGADKIIFERYGLTVDHVCAMKKNSQNGNVERERATADISTKSIGTGKPAHLLTGTESMDFQSEKELGVADISSKYAYQKLTYEDLFYKVIKNSKSKLRGGQNQRIPCVWSAGMPRDSQAECHTTVLSTASLSGRTLIATQDSKRMSSTEPRGFPIRGGSWCSQLKRSVFQKRHRTRRENKYCAISWHRRGRA